MSDQRRGSIVVVGDVHLGRLPSHLPEDISGGPREALTPKGYWQRLVDKAVDLGVDAVAMVGDVVDADNAFFEAYGPLEEGARRLVEAGIRLMAVAGNHDAEVLPRLARQVDGVTLLGAGGTWEHHELPFAHLVGWSFPGRHYQTSPLDGAKGPRELRQEAAVDERPWIGLLHGDLDVRSSSYAPVTRGALLSTELDLWLMGHVHQPSLVAGRVSSAQIGYVGSALPLDPSERGRHGAWRVDIEGRALHVEPLMNAPIRWEHLEIALQPDERDETAVRATIIEQTEARLEAIADDLDEVALLGLRLSLTGRSPLFGTPSLESIAEAATALAPSLPRTRVFVDAVTTTAVKPPVELEALARGSDPAGLLARRLTILATPGEGRAHLINRARRAMGSDPKAGNRLAATARRLSDEALVELLYEAGMAALGQLLDEDRLGGGAG